MKTLDDSKNYNGQYVSWLKGCVRLWPILVFAAQEPKSTNFIVK